MVYIDLIENKRNFWNFRKIEEIIFENTKILKLKDTRKNTLSKLELNLKKNCINRVMLSNKIMKDESFGKILNNENIQIHNGRWIFKQMMYECIEYICRQKNEPIEIQEISVLSNRIDNILVYNLKLISQNVKVINIVSNNYLKFKKIEKELNNEFGVMLNLTNDYKKSLIKSDIILNYDFEQDEINKYTIPKKSCILNFNKEIEILSKNFEGLNINYLELYSNKYDVIYEQFKDFERVALYESFIYKNTHPENIKKQIVKDNIKILFLEGKNGKIRKSEYLNLSKKIAN